MRNNHIMSLFNINQYLNFARIHDDINGKSEYKNFTTCIESELLKNYFEFSDYYCFPHDFKGKNNSIFCALMYTIQYGNHNLGVFPNDENDFYTCLKSDYNIEFINKESIEYKELMTLIDAMNSNDLNTKLIHQLSILKTSQERDNLELSCLETTNVNLDFKVGDFITARFLTFPIKNADIPKSDLNSIVHFYKNFPMELKASFNDSIEEYVNKEYEDVYNHKYNFFNETLKKFMELTNHYIDIETIKYFDKNIMDLIITKSDFKDAVSTIVKQKNYMYLGDYGNTRLCCISSLNFVDLFKAINK
jgi:hypothetical protein